MISSRIGPALAIVVALGAAVLLGIVAGQGSGLLPAPVATPVGVLADLPAAALIALLALAAALPAILGRWPVVVAAFFGWLVVEDLVRKLAGNDLRVYFVKDLLFAVLVLALLLHARKAVTGWRDAVGRAGVPLLLLVGWAVVMAVPTGLEDWRLPLVGLRLDFLYVPLVAVGYLLTTRMGDLRRWTAGLALLGGAASLVGVIQTVVGPSFLDPGVAVRGLPNLVLIRGFEASGSVYRPTGTFVDPGRFASMALVALAAALAAAVVTAGRRRRAVLLAAVVSTGAVWVSGGRAGFVVGVGLVLLAAVATAYALRQPQFRRAVQIAMLGAGAAAVFAAVAPDLLTSRLTWYERTLNPASPQNEWALRWRNYWGSTAHGVEVGGLAGQGTGSQSLGRQYLYEGGHEPEIARSVIEGGYAGVAVEWGVVGLGLWVWWTLRWLGRQWRCIRAARGSLVAGAGLVLFGWMLFFLVFGFFGGLQGFQNYLANAYFWFLSGVIFALPSAAQRDHGPGTTA